MKFAYKIIILFSFIFFGCSYQLKFEKISGKINLLTFKTKLDLNDSLKPLWDYSTTAGFHNNSFISLDSILFISDLKGDVKTLNIKTGKKIGEVSFKNPIISSLNILGNTLIIPVAKNYKYNSAIIFYNLLTGEESFRKNIEESIENKLIQDSLYIYGVSLSGEIFQLDKMGNTLFDYKIDDRFYSSPVVIADKFYCAGVSGKVYCLDIIKKKLIWIYEQKISIYTDLIVSNEYLFYCNYDGEIFCLNKNDGNLRWKLKTSSNIAAPPLVDETFLYIANLKGELYKINYIDGKIEALYSSKQIINIVPVIFNNKILLFLQDKSIRILSKNLTETKKYYLPGRPKSLPFVYKDLLIIGCEDDLIICFKIF